MGAMGITTVGTVGIPTRNQERALAFYGGTLGFETRLDVTFGGAQRWIEVVPPGAATGIALIAAADGVATGIDTGIRLNTTDADGDHAALKAAGVDVDPGVLRLGGIPPMFAFRDPDGNRLVIIERP